MLLILLLISLTMIVYVYIGYPILVYFIGIFYRRPIKINENFEPFISIIIAAHNESECITKTLTNKLELDYPKEKIEIIVVSDNSSDDTDLIVNQFASSNVKLYRLSPRQGKTAAINLGVENAKGSILVFSDANSIYHKEAIKKLVRNFADPEIGYVTGKMIYTKCSSTVVGDGISAYMAYENSLRLYETKYSSTVGVDGGIDAVRKDLYTAMRSDQLPDFVLPLTVIKKGFRVVYEPEAIIMEDSLKKSSDEYRMRVRVALRSFWAIYDMRILLFFKHNYLFSWQLWSHKVMRYICFLFLSIAFVTNAALIGKSGVINLLFLIQVAFYFGGITQPFIKKTRYFTRLLYFANYFILLNLSCAHAFVKFLCGQKQVIWTPRKG